MRRPPASAPASARAQAPSAGAGPRSRDAARTQADLIAVATEEFARKGYFGARVDEIADRSATTKRMIYYYFGDKEGLFTAVLEQVYADLRAAEQTLELAHLPPLEALAVLVRHTFEYHDARPHVAQLIAAENGHGAAHLRASPGQARLNAPIIDLIDDLLRRGRADGVVRRRATAIDLHLMMSALALYRITNTATVEASFGVRMNDDGFKERQIEILTGMLQAWLQTPDGSPD